MPLTRLVVLLLQVYKSYQVSANRGLNSFPQFLNYGLLYRYDIRCLTSEE